MNSTKFITGKIFLLTFFCLSASFLTVSAQSPKGGFGISPMKKEIVIPAGTEKTFPVTANYATGDDPENKALPLRMVARMMDWTINPDDSVKVSATNTLPRSAASWVVYSPAEFTVQPNSSETLRFTVSVPKDTVPGDYYFAVYVEDRNPPPPPKPGERLLNVRFRFFSLIYVMVPDLTQEGELEGLIAKVENGTPIISPKLTNKGNSHLRPHHSFEIRDEADHLVSEMPMQEWHDILSDKSVQLRLPVQTELPAGKYKVIYKVDFGVLKQPVFAGRTTFEITASDVLARVKDKPATETAAVKDAVPSSKAADVQKVSTLSEAQTAVKNSSGTAVVTEKIKP